MVGPRANTRSRQSGRQFLDLAARSAIDDAAFTFMIAHEAQHLARGPLLGLEGEPQVGPVEASNEHARR